VASVFKSKGKAEYTIVYTDENGDRRKKKGYTDKRETQELAVKLEKEARKIRNGEIDPKELAYARHGKTPLTDHLEDFRKSILAEGATAKHVHMVNQRARRMLDLAKAKRISDLSLSKALEAVQALRDAGLSQQSINHHIRAVKGFSRWLWSDTRAREHHLAHLKTSSVDADRRRVRRLLTPEEAAKIVRAAEYGPEMFGLSGPDRSILYDLALGTGFRAEELRTLTPERFNLNLDRPTVTALACYTKNGKEAAQPIAQSLADRLRPWVASRKPGRPVFGNLTPRTAEMLRVDLEAAGIPYETDSGFADFHSLRGDFISYVVSSGASVKTCQTLARHSSPSLTIGIYAKASLHDIAGAVESLPHLSDLKARIETLRESLRMTGTDSVVTQSATQTIEIATGDSTQVEYRSNEAPVAQLDRASVYGTEGYKFESCRVYFRNNAKRRENHSGNPPHSTGFNHIDCGSYNPAITN
jgi:site-specific recombinase XerD